MKAIALMLICAVLVLCAPHSNVAVDARGNNSPAGTESCCTPRSKTQALMDDLTIETRRGEAVVLRARQLKEKNKGVARAMKDLEKNPNLRPAFEHGLSILGVSKSGKLRKTSAQETVIVDGDVEITFIPYDDGDNSTWEGIIYYRSPAGERSDYVVINISGEPDVTYEQNYYYVRNGQPGDYEILGGLDKGQQGNAAQMKKVSYSPGAASRPTQVGEEPAIQAWVKCAAKGCIAAGIGCRLTGPLWADCAAAACLAVMVQCALDQLIR